MGPSGSGGFSGLENAFSGTSVPHQTVAAGHSTELEDPPGLYEKVYSYFCCKHSLSLYTRFWGFVVM